MYIFSYRWFRDHSNRGVEMGAVGRRSSRNAAVSPTTIFLPAYPDSRGMPGDGTPQSSDSNHSRDGSSVRRNFLKGAATIGAASVAGCLGGGGGGTTGSPTDSTPDEFIIGSNHPLSGSLGYTGTTMHRAIQLAAKERNENGGIEGLGGAEVKVLKGDNQAKPTKGAQVEKQLIDNGAHALTGCFNSDTTLSATKVAEREKVPHVITVAASARILQERDMNWAYRIQPTTAHFGRDYARFMPEMVRDAGFDFDTVAHYYIDNLYGAEVHENIKKHANDNDFELVESTPITLDAKSASSQVTKIKEADPDAVCITGYFQDASLFVEAMNNQDYTPPFLTASASVGFVSEDFVEKLGETALGVVDTNYALNPNNSMIDGLAERYRKFSKSKGEERALSPEAALSWAVAHLIFDAADRAGSADSKALNEAIRNTELGKMEQPMAMPGVEFQDNGENKLAQAAQNQVRENYNVKVVYPDEYAAVEPDIQKRT